MCFLLRYLVYHKWYDAPGVTVVRNRNESGFRPGALFPLLMNFFLPELILIPAYTGQHSSAAKLKSVTATTRYRSCDDQVQAGGTIRRRRDLALNFEIFRETSAYLPSVLFLM